MTLPTNTDIDNAIPPLGSTRPRSDLANAVLKNMLAEIAAARRDSVSPKDFGAVGDKIVDDTSAVVSVINLMNSAGVAGRFDGGIWRITSALPTVTRPVFVGDGSGAIYVDYNVTAGAAVLDCAPPIGEVYTVTAVAQVTYDANGAFTDDSTVTKLTLSLGGGQSMPAKGSIGKLTATNVLAANGGTDQTGQHVYILDVVGSDVFVPAFLYDTFSTSMQLIMLGTNPCSLEGFSMIGNYSSIVANDLRYHFARVTGAIAPPCRRLTFIDGSDVGLLLAGTYAASTDRIRVRRMRNATASESPQVLGYGVQDAGSWLSQHRDLGGVDCRHVYTTNSVAPSFPRIMWGRTFRPQIVGGQASGCSAAAYDCHADCVGSEFQNLRVVGGYLGEDSAGIGIQLRGAQARALNCSVADLPVGIQVKKTYVGEVGQHSIQGYRYDGSGIGISLQFEAGLTGSDQRQRVRVGNSHIRTSGFWGIGLSAADLEITGRVLVEHVGAPASTSRAVDLSNAATIRSAGGKLVHDFSDVSNAPNPRPINCTGDLCAIPGLDVQVIAGSITWRGVVCEGNSPAASMGECRVNCDADAPPTSASGGFSSNGSNTLLSPGMLRGFFTINNSRAPANKAANFAITAWDNRRRITCTSPITVTVPSAAVLGPDFECFIIADGATVIIDGTGTTNLTINAGQNTRIGVRNGKVWCSGANNMTLLS